jgi:hypothetical protein
MGVGKLKYNLNNLYNEDCMTAEMNSEMSGGRSIKEDSEWNDWCHDCWEDA